MQTTTNYGLKKPEGNEFISIEDLNDNADEIDRLLEERLKKTGDASNVTNAFSQASTRANLSTGEKISVSLGKIMKWFTDLKNVAFSGKASDLEQDANNRLVTDTEKSSWNGKVDTSSGDIQNTKVGTFTASSASWPVPAAGETVKVILGKIVKYFTDLNSWRSTVVLIANIVNNCTSTDTNKPLSANQGKVLMDGKAPKSHASTATTYGAGNASSYGHVKVSDNYTSSAGAASAGVAASSKAVADAYAKLNSDLNLYDYVDYSWNSNSCDAHIYKCGHILQIYVHVTYSSSGLNIGDLEAFSEREIYSVNADKWKPWVDVLKVPMICDSNDYPNCYFSFYADGKIKLGTRQTVIPANANKHFYGFACCIAKP